MTMHPPTRNDRSPVDDPNRPRRSRVRFSVAIMIFLITVINFSDRGVLGAIGPILISKFHLTIVEFGFISGSFGFGYVISTLLGGATLRLFGGPTRVFVIFVTAWSLAIGATALAEGYHSLLSLRILFGFCEGITYPASYQLASRWFAAKEQGRYAAWGLTLGQSVGPVLAAPIATALAVSVGWQLPFVVWMVIGLIWALVAAKVLTDDPTRNPRVSAAELAEINVGKFPHVAAADDAGVVRTVLLNPYLWLCGLCFFASAYALYFLLTFFPVYLVQSRHIAYEHVGIMGAMPFIGLGVGAFCSGWLLDKLWVWTSGNMYLSRTLVAACMQTLAGCVFLITALTDVSNSVVMVLFFVGSVFSQAGNAVFFALPADVMPRHAGAAGGLVTGIASSAGIFAPMITGYLVSETGSYTSAVAVVAAVPMISAFFLITVNPWGKLSRQKQAWQNISAESKITL